MPLTAPPPSTPAPPQPPHDSVPNPQTEEETAGPPPASEIVCGDTELTAVASGLSKLSMSAETRAFVEAYRMVVEGFTCDVWVEVLCAFLKGSLGGVAGGYCLLWGGVGPVLGVVLAADAVAFWGEWGRIQKVVDGGGGEEGLEGIRVPHLLLEGGGGGRRKVYSVMVGSVGLCTALLTVDRGVSVGRAGVDAADAALRLTRFGVSVYTQGWMWGVGQVLKESYTVYAGHVRGEGEGGEEESTPIFDTAQMLAKSVVVGVDTVKVMYAEDPKNIDLVVNGVKVVGGKGWLWGRDNKSPDCGAVLEYVAWLYGEGVIGEEEKGKLIGLCGEGELEAVRKTLWCVVEEWEGEGGGMRALEAQGEEDVVVEGEEVAEKEIMVEAEEIVVEEVEIDQGKRSRAKTPERALISATVANSAL